MSIAEFSRRTFLVAWLSWMAIELAGGIALIHRVNHNDYHEPLPWISRLSHKLNPFNYL